MKYVSIYIYHDNKLTKSYIFTDKDFKQYQDIISINTKKLYGEFYNSEQTMEQKYDFLSESWDVYYIVHLFYKYEL